VGARDGHFAQDDTDRKRELIPLGTWHGARPAPRVFIYLSKARTAVHNGDGFTMICTLFSLLNPRCMSSMLIQLLVYLIHIDKP
jgi:hypothetical protein